MKRHALEWVQAYTLDVLRNKISWSKLVGELPFLKREFGKDLESYIRAGLFEISYGIDSILSMLSDKFAAFKGS